MMFRSLMKREIHPLVDRICKVKLVSVSVPLTSPLIIAFVSVLPLVKVHTMIHIDGILLGAPASVPAGSTYPVKLEVNYDYDLFDEKLAHDFKVKPVETEFIKLEEKMRRVANELAAMVQNEAAMRSVNGTLIPSTLAIIL